MIEVFIDFETRCHHSIKTLGAYRYVEDPSFEPILLSLAVEDRAVRVFEDDEIIDALRHYSGADVNFVGWGNFERIILNRYKIRYNKYIDASIVAAEYGLPLKLELAAQAARIEHEKDARGGRLIAKFCKPRRNRKGEEGVHWFDSATSPDEWSAFREYNERDTVAMREIYRICPELSIREERLRLLDQRMTDHGQLVDMDAVKQFQELRIRTETRANEIVARITEGFATTTNQVAQLAEWCGLPDLTAPTVQRALDNKKLDKDTRMVLTCRQVGGKSSGKKLDAFINTASLDNRLRGMIQFCGTPTRRWAGRLVQLHNLPRVGLSLEQFHELLLAAPQGPGHVLRTSQMHATTAISKALKGLILPDPGMLFLVADYSAIEARILVWLAGQDDVLEMYYHGIDLYKAMASRIFGVPVDEVTDAQRFMGKTLVLGCGYMLGAAKLQASLWEKEEIWIELEEAQSYITGYREAYDRVANLWDCIKKAMMQAIRSPGKTFAYWRNTEKDSGPMLRFMYNKRRDILMIKLPGGSVLRYHEARVQQVPAPWDAKKTIAAVTAMSREKTGWYRRAISPGLATENVVQSIAREVMADAMLALDDAGLPPSFTVHDEIIDQAPEKIAISECQRMIRIMERAPSWGAGLPLKVEAKVMPRYGKDGTAVDRQGVALGS